MKILKSELGLGLGLGLGLVLEIEEMGGWRGVAGRVILA